MVWDRNFYSPLSEQDYRRQAELVREADSAHLIVLKMAQLTDRRSGAAPPRPEAWVVGHFKLVPTDFRFLLKAPRQLVEPNSPHYLDAEWAERFFLEPARRGLGTRLGVAHFFFPPGRHGELRHGSRSLMRCASAWNVPCPP